MHLRNLNILCYINQFTGNQNLLYLCYNFLFNNIFHWVKIIYSLLKTNFLKNIFNIFVIHLN